MTKLSGDQKLMGALIILTVPVCATVFNVLSRGLSAAADVSASASQSLPLGNTVLLAAVALSISGIGFRLALQMCKKETTRVKNHLNNPATPVDNEGSNPGKFQI